ncbi:MAG: hypothetical protein A2493_02650 [Candidatus Magasanikbacteria bacterium RIFOXYC12_FULL_33_11]|uniref:Uncharacterized protein n=1 Tax=Candidatus Magasanikbacteria bacterium RIFOXYC12_FULL_33_11 TaxID=1798701 RepID=A0A1F6NS59_9BACT|nr:MAG: hypothetical protein A2493_02650 [Candidatus Magasanikbacteria bacterium RIFOXYC12_FULL_33_11]
MGLAVEPDPDTVDLNEDDVEPPRVTPPPRDDLVHDPRRGIVDPLLPGRVEEVERRVVVAEVLLGVSVPLGVVLLSDATALAALGHESFLFLPTLVGI